MAEIENFMSNPQHLVHLDKLDLKPSDLAKVFKVLQIDGARGGATQKIKQAS